MNNVGIALALSLEAVGAEIERLRANSKQCAKDWWEAKTRAEAAEAKLDKTYRAGIEAMRDAMIEMTAGPWHELIRNKAARLLEEKP